MWMVSDLTLRQFCAELQQTHKVEMGLEVERQVQRIEQATMQQADQTDRVARQLRAKNDVLRNFCQAENETPDSLKTAEYVDVPDEGAYLNTYIPKRSNSDKSPPSSSTWGCELLELCQSTELLIVNGRTLGDIKGGVYLH
ncbi:TPA: hypothetical protein ACH3X1_008333 [Trebouxia sp. C0004]